MVMFVLGHHIPSSVNHRDGFQQKLPQNEEYNTLGFSKECEWVITMTDDFLKTTKNENKNENIIR